MDITTLYALFLQHPDICTDTRKIKPGCLFFALQGANFDGNAFASEALNLGAAYAVVSDPGLQDDQFLHVNDTLLALQSLAQFHRIQLGKPLIAITGSNGKTTTKELVTVVLNEKYNVHATKGNLNNHIGVPMTLLGASSETEIIVCEMGANHKGEIKMLCEIAQPTHGVITNIGQAHLEGFGSIEGIQQAKGELFRYLLDHNGFAFVNVDDHRLAELGKSLPNKITFGFNSSDHPDIHFNYSTGDQHKGFMIQNPRDNVQIQSEMFGDYNASNMLAAYVIGDHFNVPREKMMKSLAAFIPGSNRSESVSYKGCTVIKDAYNANPTSMELALRSFASRFPNGWIILGDMKELGKESLNAHRKIIDVIRELSFQNVALIGKDFKSALVDQPGQFQNLVTADYIDELKTSWDWNKCEGQTLLLKGSRSMNLESILE